MQETPDSSLPGTQPAPLFEARGMKKRYGHVPALRGADFSAYSGEVVALIGDNGAGKSTFVRLLAGAEIPDGGELFFAGEPVSWKSPEEAQQHGIEVVYQDLALALDLDTAANLYLGREVRRKGFLGNLGLIDHRRMRQETQAKLMEFGIRLQDVKAPTRTLSGGQRQSVAVARAAAFASKIIFMDEPTAALGVKQTKAVYELIRRLRDSGMTIVLISHNMEDVLALADRVEVLRLGRRVGQFVAKDTTIEDLVRAMTSGMAEVA